MLGTEQLHVTSQTLRNHFRVAKEVCQHTHSTRSVVGVDATKHVQLPISSEPTGLVFGALVFRNRFLYGFMFLYIISYMIYVIVKCRPRGVYGI